MDPQSVPHISAVIYGVGRILHPEMHWDSTPELLDAFALAEAIRQQTVADATEALLWDQFYRKGGATDADGDHLTDQERKSLKAIAKKSSDETLRETYRTVVMQICWAHIHRLRRSNETFFIPLFFRRYFPAIDDLKKSELQDSNYPLWLRGMSDNELIVYGVIRKKIMEFLEDAEQWEEQYLNDLSTSSTIRNTREFQAQFHKRFPLIVEWGALTGILQRHLTKVQNMVAKLHSIFLDSDLLPDVEGNTDNQSSPLRSGARRESGSGLSTHPFSRQESQDDIKMTVIADGRIDDEEKKESQESNVSSKISYVEVPQNVARAPPTSLLRRI